MKIIADENLAFTEYFFEEFEVEQCAGRTLQAKDAEALLIRSVTQLNEKLLKDSHVKFVGSATIGTDHLDIAYLEKQQIKWCNAAGCNAQAVAEYVVTALLHVNPKFLHQNITLGIVGLGNVGKRLSALAQRLGWNVVAYDPFITKTTWAELLSQSDAISIHVPLTKTGDYPTYHLFHEKTFKQMKPDTVLINSARGAVISEQALLEDIKYTQRKVVLDVFEHEPVISQAVLDAVTLVTPHIAGYSLEGKARGTQMVYDQFCEFYQRPKIKDFRTQLPSCQQYFGELKTVLEQPKRLYNIAQDDANLRACLKNGVVEQSAFDDLRKNYPLRREWASHGDIA
ncbi:4-phosphoerythronate dehydrogenase [Acinetobacter sp. HY1485]|uniref:4-phosphoerythronate dehydrogenase n=1 Tax=Acinetobacter sp. HY1485 TaxID=2970918 RepID=UPI0022B9C4E4|nr:4-phosphoerythronate dehydrogenase [Acinetobacter sp. HY1485]